MLDDEQNGGTVLLWLKVESPNIINYILGGGFKYFLFSPLPGEMIQFD